MFGDLRKYGTVGVHLLGLAAAGLLAVSCSHPAVPSRPDVALVHLERASLADTLPAIETVTQAQGLEAEVVAGINRFRAKRGRTPFARHGGLDQLAEDHADGMMRIRHMSHDGFSKRVRAAENDHAMSWLSENVMWGLGYQEGRLAEIIVQGWIDSPGHRKNLLRDNHFIGIGISRGADGSVWAAQLSARSR